MTDRFIYPIGAYLSEINLMARTTGYLCFYHGDGDGTDNQGDPDWDNDPENPEKWERES